VSYDLLVFEPGIPPDDRVAFIAWFSQVIRLRDGHLAADPTQTSPSLQRWHEGMAEKFPQVGTPRAHRPDAREIDFNADYRFAPHAIFARFEWSVSRKAYHHAMKLARLHGCGFFDASGENAMVYTFVNGRFILAHRGEASHDDEKPRLSGHAR
jgi:hypothetical protein